MSELQTYTWLELTEHMTEESCWLVFEGKVYDVTKYLDDHPGSRKPLLKYAGQDATAPFKRVGHSQSAVNIRESMLVGQIEEAEPTKEYWFKVRTARWEFNKFTAEEVAKHNTSGDIWIIVDGHVYDFSNLEHPGGQAVIDKYAGKDGSAVFNKIEAHTEKTIKYRETFKIGKLDVPPAPEKKKQCCPLPKFCMVATVGIVAAVGIVAYKKWKK